MLKGRCKIGELRKGPFDGGIIDTTYNNGRGMNKKNYNTYDYFEKKSPKSTRKGTSSQVYFYL